jgi:hypothetical protein
MPARLFSGYIQTRAGNFPLDFALTNLKINLLILFFGTKENHEEQSNSSSLTR